MTTTQIGLSAFIYWPKDLNFLQSFSIGFSTAFRIGYYREGTERIAGKFNRARVFWFFFAMNKIAQTYWKIRPSRGLLIAPPLIRSKKSRARNKYSVLAGKLNDPVPIAWTRWMMLPGPKQWNSPHQSVSPRAAASWVIRPLLAAILRRVKASKLYDISLRHTSKTRTRLVPTKSLRQQK